MSSQRKRITQHIADYYGAEPEFLWAKSPQTAIFRHQHNRRWFAVMMNLSGSLFGAAHHLDVINVKLPPEWVSQMRIQSGFAPAYHMNKQHWLSVRSDDFLPDEIIENLLSESFLRTQ